jgi:hypothetical protein
VTLEEAYWDWPTEQDNDPARLRTIADYLDGLDDAVGNEIRTMQEELRRIASELEAAK